MTTLAYSGPFELPDDATTTVKTKAAHADRWWTPSAQAESEFKTEGSWLDITDNEHWDPDLVSAPTQYWDSENGQWVADVGRGRAVLNLTPIGSWADGLRPTLIRITHGAETPPYLSLYDTGEEYILFEETYVSGTTAIIVFGENDIGRLRIDLLAEQAFTVSKIEVLVF